ncbi:MAG: hypothetical protein CL524_00645 [Aequorivita sp.]|nr:hypothetical protein [Aequorivita sp.]
MNAFETAWLVVKGSPLDWHRTGPGEKWLGAGHTPIGDSVATFRNLGQQYKGKPGVMSVQRKLSGKGSNPITIEAGNLVPLMDPHFKIDTSPQFDAWWGNPRYRAGGRKKDFDEEGLYHDPLARPPGRTVHAKARGNLPLSEAQQYLTGDLHPGDLHDFDTTTDKKGQAIVLDEHGEHAPLITYWPFSRDENGEITYRNQTEEPFSGQTGSGGWVSIPHEGAEPIPIADGYQHQGLGVSTPRGIFLPRRVA